MPGLLTDDELAFEEDLATVTEGGFLHQRRFGFPPLSQRFYTDDVPPRIEGDEKVREAAASCNICPRRPIQFNN